ncbi:MFS transporter [Frateuria aurantia]|uniref:Arabinose efflux permease family protein n=1 Tax=Frateuria aurantia (strain ATCC 33424 / DSM 6220 / KCTC 2777 / LMG 1558 / NBRC 3245 / NCIMB 13370) TaxID=767434 RepID=H8KZE4_FRAAD|nr:MFS transporter [Frateuria aurantia]AFC86186.1 arabinose efflux permease family protein [Frateuria aurantia DSM 6220]
MDEMERLPGKFGLDQRQLRTLGLTSLGGILEYYEFTLFIFLTPVIMKVFFPEGISLWLQQVQTLGIFAAGYIARPLGATLLATLGDRHGRRKAMLTSMTGMALATLAIGLLPGWHRIGAWAPLSLLLLRIVQGSAVGGELPAAIVLVAEHVPARRLGLAFGILGASFGMGFVLSSGLVDLLSLGLDQHQWQLFGWRLPFLLGGGMGLMMLWLRRHLDESPVFAASKETGKDGLLKRLARLWKEQRPALLRCLAASIAPAILIPAVQLYPATYFVVVAHYPLQQVAHAQAMMQVGTLCGALLGGWCVDRLGWRRMIPSVAICLLLALVHVYVFSRGEHLATSFFVLGAGVSYVVMVYQPLVYSFPPALRISGIAVVYNLSAAVFGGTTPMLLAVWTRHGPTALVVLPALACLISVVTTPWLWKYRRHDLLS